MILDNNDRLLLKTVEYGQKTEVAAIKGISEYPDPDGDGSASKQFPDGKMKASHSRFSPIFSLNLWDNIRTDEDFAANRAAMEPTLKNLITAETQAPGLQYEASDFMHCKYAEAVSGYHLITLRRFGNPVEDGLFFEDHPQVDLGRLVTYTTEESNKLSELMTMSFGLNWRELTADFWTPDVIGDEYGHSGLIGQLYRFSNPMWMQSKGLGKNAINIDPMYDQNKTYGPVDSITKTHIRDRGINFDQSLNVTFEYDLKSYDGVNPKSAMIDLISNILVVTMNDAKFWGGGQKWRGIPKSAFNKYVSQGDALSIGTDFNSTVNYYKGVLKQQLGGGSSLAMLLSLAKQLLNGLAGFTLDKLCSTIGRPTVAVMNSLLSGEAVGTWHLTVGNPYRPILSIGNLILTNTQMSFGDTIGHDGFPTSLKIVCTLKHAKPRSRAEIEMMFNAGHARTYWQPKSDVLKARMANSHVYAKKGSQFTGNITNEIYTYLRKDLLGDSGGATNL